MYCPSCGAENEAGRPLCYRCGTSLHDLEPTELRLSLFGDQATFSRWLLLLLTGGLAALALVFALRFSLAPDPQPLPTPQPTWPARPKLPAVAMQRSAATPITTTRPGGISGQVLAHGTGGPVAAAEVIIGDRAAVTDGQGRFFLAGLTPGPYVAIVTRPGYAPGVSAIVPVENGEMQSVDMVLYPAAEPEAAPAPLTDDVLDPEGAPTAEEARRLAWEQGLYSDIVWASPVTLRGRYWVNCRLGEGPGAAIVTLDEPGWLLADDGGQVWRIVQRGGGLAMPVPPGWLLPVVEGDETDAQDDAEAPSPIGTATLALTPLPAELGGQVRDGVSGAPIAGAVVSIGDRQTTTDAEGRYLFSDLVSGRYSVLVQATEYDPVLLGIVQVGVGQQSTVDAALPAAGAGEYPRDPMASHQIEPAGAPTAAEAERLARLQGLRGEVASIREVTLEGEYLVNYKAGDIIRAAMAPLHHPAWELVDAAGQSWYIVRLCGNLAVARPPEVEVPAQCVARPYPVVTVGQQPVRGYACPSEKCLEAAELAAGWHGVALACAPGCDWLQVRCPDAAGGDCWLRREWLATWGDLAGLKVVPVAVSGQIAFFSDRDSPGYGEIYLMNPDGSDQLRLTSDLRLPAVMLGGADWVINFRWSPARRQFFFNTGNNGRFYRVDADGQGGTLIAEQITGIDLAPDGRRIVAAVHRSTSFGNDIVIMKPNATEQTVLTTALVRAGLALEADSRLLGPTWSPDGRSIAFYSHGPDSICLVDSDGSRSTVLATEMYAIAGAHMDWSPDGKAILFPEISQTGILDVDSGQIRYLVADGLHPTWSPDGGQIVLSRPFAGKDAQIWIVNADDTGLRQLTTEGQNCCPIWLP